jgi:hypothetical protein
MMRQVATRRRDGIVEEPWLLFELTRGRYALPLAAVDGVTDFGSIREVHDAPADVRGLTHWRGTLLTVVDLPQILKDAGLPVRASLVRLAPPLRGAALFVPAPLRLAWAPAQSVIEKHVVCEGRPFQRLDPAQLIPRDSFHEAE